MRRVFSKPTRTRSSKARRRKARRTPPGTSARGLQVPNRTARQHRRAARRLRTPRRSRNLLRPPTPNRRPALALETKRPPRNLNLRSSGVPTPLLLFFFFGSESDNGVILRFPPDSAKPTFIPCHAFFFFSHPVTVEEAAVWVIQPLESRFFSVEPGWLLLRRMEHPGPQAPCLDEDTSIYVFVEDTARTTHLSHSHTHISSFFLFLFPFPPTCFSVIIVISLGLCCGTWQRGPSRDGSVGCREGCQSRRDGSDPRRDYTHQGVTGTFF